MLASAGSSIKFWTIGDHNELSLTSQLKENVHDLSYSCDGNYLASLSRNYSEISLNVISGSSAAKIVINKFIDNPTCIQFTNSNSRFLGAGGSDNLLIWDIKANNLKKKFKIPGRADISKISFSMSDSHTAIGTKKGNLFLVSNSYNSISSLIKMFNHETEPTDLQYSRHNQFLLGAGCDRGNVVLVDTNVGKVTKNFRHVHEAPVTSLIFSPFNELLMSSVGYDKKIVFYTLNVKSVISSQSKQEPLTSAAFHPNGKHIMIGTITGEMELLDLRMLSEPVSVVKAYNEAITDIKFHPIGKSKSKKKSESSQPSRNIVNDIKENVAPETTKEEKVTPNIFSPIRNVQSPNPTFLTKNDTGNNRNLLGSTQTNRHENYKDVLSPPKLSSSSQYEMKMNLQQSYNDFDDSLLSPARKREDSSCKSSKSIRQNECKTQSKSEILKGFRNRIDSLGSLSLATEFNDMAEKVERVSTQDSAKIAQSDTTKRTEENFSHCLKQNNLEDSAKFTQIIPDIVETEIVKVDDVENPTKRSTTPVRIAEEANNCCSGNLSIIQNHIRMEFENHEMRTNQRLMDLHYNVYKQFFSLRNEMVQMMEDHNSIYFDLINENNELKQEVERLRKNY